MHADQAWAARTPFTAPRLRTAAPLPLPLVAITDTNSARTAQLCSLSLRLPCSARARVISSLSSACVRRWILPSISAAEQCSSFPYSFLFLTNFKEVVLLFRVASNLQFT